MNQNYIVYQAYGSEAILHEALYSILSFYKVHGPGDPGITVVVYTDRNDFFEFVLGRERVVCRHLDPSVVKQWRGSIDFVHRVKIEMLADFTHTLQNDAVLYLDSDTYFLKPVHALFEKIVNGTVMMHEFEGRLNNSSFPLIKKVGKFVRHHQHELSTQGFDVPPDSSVFNAGVIGFQATKKALLSQVLHFTDYFYKLYPKHIAEQFGFSLYLSREGTILSTDEYIFHYWRFKEFRVILKDFFHHHRASDVHRIIRELDMVSPVAMEEPKRKYENMPWFTRALRKLSKNRWRMPDYRYWEK